jgi:hypothetical protein
MPVLLLQPLTRIAGQRSLAPAAASDSRPIGRHRRSDPRRIECRLSGNAVELSSTARDGRRLAKARPNRIGVAQVHEIELMRLLTSVTRRSVLICTFIASRQSRRFRHRAVGNRIGAANLRRCGFQLRRRTAQRSPAPWRSLARQRHETETRTGSSRRSSARSTYGRVSAVIAVTHASRQLEPRLDKPRRVTVQERGGA